MPVEATMDDTREPDTSKKVTSDTVEYSATKAPETRAAAEEEDQFSDVRLRPGGAHGTRSDVGMSGIDREATPSGAHSIEEDEYGRPPRMSER
jgi:hypothetical protein